jgi:hypothetical protein
MQPAGLAGGLLLLRMRLHCGIASAFAAELKAPKPFPRSDALHLESVHRIDLGVALAVILEAYPHRQGEKIDEALLEPLVAGDLTANVADHTAESGAQEFEFAPRPLELVGKGGRA